MSYKKRFESTYEKVDDDEPIFILRAQDQLAPMIVEAWAEIAAKMKVDPQKVLGAYQCAQEMRNFGGSKKIPD